MSATGGVAVLIVVVAAILMVLTATIQAAISYVNRSLVHIYASRAGIPPEARLRTLGERQNLFSALEIAHSLAGVFATSFVLYLVLQRTGLHVRSIVLAGLATTAGSVLLQSLPRALIRQNPERWGIVLAPVAKIYWFLFGWIGWLFDLPGALLLRVLPLPAMRTEDQPEELLSLVELEETSGGIEEEERQMIRGIIRLEDTTAGEVMVPRPDIAAVSIDDSLDDVIQVIVSRGFSRVPLYEHSIDTIVGILYAKDILRSLAAQDRSASLADLTRPAYFIPETKKVDELLAELRQNKVHMAIVVDEYGGTAGLVTIEDLIEEIVGEIEDEYDLGEATVERLGEHEAIVDARASIDVLDDVFGVQLDEEDVHTIGGLIYNHLGRIPSEGDAVTIGDLTITVLSLNRHRIGKVRIVRAAQPASTPGNGQS